jgi:hypothetical protein
MHWMVKPYVPHYVRLDCLWTIKLLNVRLIVCLVSQKQHHDIVFKDVLVRLTLMDLLMQISSKHVNTIVLPQQLIFMLIIEQIYVYQLVWHQCTQIHWLAIAFYFAPKDYGLKILLGPVQFDVTQHNSQIILLGHVLINVLLLRSKLSEI